MTEKLPPLSTQIVLPSQNAPVSTTIVSAQDPSHKVETVEEEPYTIKCICKYTGDDGNTIFCESCDTWQHIECFYPDNVQDACSEEFAHSCADCKPRPLDRQKAYEHQKSRMEGLMAADAVSDKKTKRPASKSHKKKLKPNDLQLNGQGGTDSTKNNSSHDHPATKKSKTSHKPSQSISSQPPKRSPPYGAGRANPGHAHPLSPASTPPELPPDFEIHNYSPGFLTSHSQKEVPTTQTNSFANLSISNSMSLWLRDPEKLRQDTGEEFSDVFQTLPSNIDALKRPLRLESKIVPLSPDTMIRWQCLTTPTAVEKDVPLAELNGQIGTQRDYCADKSNRWEELTSPLPFVFFHELLPLYIDTRNEGSRARFVRRSCKPNAVIDTFLSGGSEYHFWLVSDRQIAANEQITIAWDLRFPKSERARLIHLLGLGDDAHGPHEKQEMDEEEYQQLSGWIHRVLSEHGGCACDLGNNCAFVRFHRSYHARSQARNITKKKSRKPKTHAVSPTSTGHATNSRAASEGRLDDGGDAEVGSASGSSRSKPPSRDMTPAHTTPAPRQGSFDTLGILTEPTDRDKRKVAMVEDSFRRMEQTQPPRKKKRVSDGSLTTTSAKSKSKSTVAQANGVHYVDSGTSRSKTGSPTSTSSPSMPNPSKPAARRHSSNPVISRIAPRSPAKYCNASIQTDPVQGEWYSEPGPTIRPRRSIMSLSKRLLENRHKARQEKDEQRKKRDSIGSLSTSDAMGLDSPTPEAKHPPSDPPSAPASEPNHDDTVDTPMPDAPASPIAAKQPPPVPVSVDGEELTSPGRVEVPVPELRVQMPPPQPTNGTVALATSATTSTAPAFSVQSPFANMTLASPLPLSATCPNGAGPSPVKKKLSLSDYTKSRKAAASRPLVGTSLKGGLAGSDEPRSATGTDTPQADSPSTERATESLGPSTDAVPSEAVA